MATENFRRCQACKVQAYCLRDHQKADRGAHKVTCIGVKKAQENLDEEETALRAEPPDFGLPPNVLKRE